MKDGNAEVVDITTEDGLKKARASVKSEIERIDTCSHFIIIMSKPYLPVFFKRIGRYLNLLDYSEFLGAMWSYVEFPNADPNVTQKEYVSMFLKADKQRLMTPEEYAIWKSLPDEITVYRGVSGEGAVKKLSWTLSRKKAEWFANRWNQKGRVYQAKIKKEDVLAYFGERGEAEIVLNPFELMDIIKMN